MPLLAIPKLWSPNEVPSSADMNANFAAIAASVNAVENVQISPTAAIQGSKIASAPNGIGTAQLNSASVLQGNLAVGVTTVAQAVVEASAQTEGITGTEKILATRTQARAGGGVLLIGTVVLQVRPLDANPVRVRVRMLQDTGSGDSAIGVPIEAEVEFDDLDWEQGIQLAWFAALPPAVVASVTWKLTATRMSGAATIDATGWQLLVWELR